MANESSVGPASCRSLARQSLADRHSQAEPGNENVAAVRADVNRALAGARKGEAARLAEEAGFSSTTLSRFRSGTYRGNEEEVAEKLGKILGDRRAADAIAAGRAKLNWLIAINGNLRLTKTAATLERLQTEHPEAAVFKVWFDPANGEVYLVRSVGQAFQPAGMTG